MTRERYATPIQSKYALNISHLKPSEIYDNYNPGKFCFYCNQKLFFLF